MSGLTEQAVSSLARSREGHAAYAMSGIDDRWIVIQKNTFTNWVNEQLRSTGQRVEDLQTDFCDGIKLCALMEVLQQKRVGRVVKKPVNQHQFFDNVNLAIRAMTNDGIKLVNIGNEDVVNGNLKLILALVWHLILRYQIGKQSKVPPKKLMLAWINAVIPECRISNFSHNWNDGVALHGLIEYCRPGTFPDWRQLSRSNGVTNCKRAMEMAKDLFGIPLVLSPENLASEDLDELSGMTYLSYFMKVNSPGYHATLRWVRSIIPGVDPNNFQSDWNDGKAVIALVNTLGGRVDGSNGDWVANCQAGMKAASEQLKVEPVITAKEMADPEVDHLGVMAYAAWFHHIKEVKHVPSVPPAPVKPKGQMLALTDHTSAGKVNQPTKFNVELLDDEVDKSKVKVEVVGPSGKPPVNLSFHGHTGQGQFIPTEPGEHTVVVYYEGEVVRGCPAPVRVEEEAKPPPKPKINLTSAMVESLKVNDTTQFTISAEDARRGAVRVEARAPSGRVMDLGVGDNAGVFQANFTPTEVGDWVISILYDGEHIQGSPFNVRVYDAAQVKVFGLEGGAVGKTFSFSADCSGAGEGTLHVDINHDNREVPVNIYQEGRGLYRVNFTPDGAGVYTIRVYFAGMEVSGSPYSLEIVDSSMVTASGEGLSSVAINKATSFLVNTKGAGGGDIRVNVSSPSGALMPCQVFNMGDETYRVEYTPTEVGEYLIETLFFGKPISGSPFRVQVYDWNRIYVKNLTTSASVGRIVEFDIDASQAGSGNLEIMVNDGTIPCNVQNRGHRQFHASFTPEEGKPHFVQMRFNGQPVPGSPWRVDVRGAAHVTVATQSLTMLSANSMSSFEVKTGVEGGILTANIKSPTGRNVQNRVINQYGGNYRVEFTPIEAGTYSIELTYDGQLVPGSPFLAKVYNSQGISVSPIPNGTVGRPVEFTIDVNNAGEGQLEIMINRGSVPNSVRMIRKGVYQVSFVPRSSQPHTVDIKFNGEIAPGCPINVPIMDSSRVTVHGEGLHQVAVNKQSYFRVNTQSAGDAELSVRVTAPNGELVPAKIVMQPDGDYKVEYSSKYTGRHMVEILYAGQPIMGSPFYVEIYDPNKLLIDGDRGGHVGQPVQFEVNKIDAGKAELAVNVTAPSGRRVQYDSVPTSVGERFTYIAQEPGIHNIYITYGGLDVPGCPLKQDIVDSSTANAYGDGLYSGEEDRVCSFFVDTKGVRGDLFVQVDGPNSIAKCNIEPEGAGKYQVSYVPVEVGIYDVQIKWNNREISGSPFHPKIVNPRKVVPVGGWEGFLDHNGSIHLMCNEHKRIEIDTLNAGPGKMAVDITGPSGKPIPSDLEQRGEGRYLLSFTPTMEGDYFLNMRYGDLPLPRSPYLAKCGSAVDHNKVVLTGHGLQEARVKEEADFVVDGSQAGAASHGSSVGYGGSVGHGGSSYSQHSTTRTTTTTHQSNMLGGGLEHNKVILSGHGLEAGRVRDESEFVIDGSGAGPGKPAVKLTGVKQDIPVNVVDIGGDKYRCTYIPQTPGAYLLHIYWSEFQVKGSPFKVNVIAPGDATKVMCSGEGLKMGVIGKEIKSMIDTRRAGPGELTAYCMGPTKVANCELYDHRNGTFTLNVKPQEAGRHQLHIKYGGQHVEGSPFTLKVAGAPDASKVRVSGPGIQPGILAKYKSFFLCETKGAGAGQLTVRIRGPKGAFRVEMQRSTQKDRTIQCRYDPTEVGDYIIHIKWSGEHVPGSPFKVQIFDTIDEVQRATRDHPHIGYNHVNEI